MRVTARKGRLARYALIPPLAVQCGYATRKPVHRKRERRMTAYTNASLSPRLVARRAGVALVLTALATALGVAARIAAGDGGADSSPMHAVWGAGTLASGVGLFMAARLISGTRLAWDGNGSPLSPALFGVSGVFTAVSGICSLALYAVAPDAATGDMLEYGRRLSGVVGFASAGLALLVAARHQWRTGGGAMLGAAAASALIGLLMQAIWLETAQIAHRIGGLAFLAWLVAAGIALWRGWASADSGGDG